MTRRNVMRDNVNKDLAKLIRFYEEHPTLIDYRMRDILEGHRNIFRNFFGVDP